MNRLKPHAKSALIFSLAICAGMFVPMLETSQASPAQQATPQLLQLTISLDQPTITEPFPARVTLHFHNSSGSALWLYRPVRDAASMFMGEVNSTSNGSFLAVHLQLNAAENASGAPGTTVPGVGTVLRSPDFPHPNLVSISAGQDYVVTTTIHLAPASVHTPGGNRPLWGSYEMSVAYNATFSDAQALRQNADVNLWEGAISSNSVPLRLEPAPDSARGVISGVVVDRETRPAAGILVSISDWHEHLITQQVTAADGEFYIDGLPAGRYWVTVRRAEGNRNTGFFEHAEITDAHPEARLHLVMLHEHVYQGRRILHKPVFFRITDIAGNPEPNAQLEILWDDGTVLSNVKVKANNEGLAEVDLIPGTNYVTIRKHGCQKKDGVAKVSRGGGIDVFAMRIRCKTD